MSNLNSKNIQTFLDKLKKPRGTENKAPTDASNNIMVIDPAKPATQEQREFIHILLDHNDRNSTDPKITKNIKSKKPWAKKKELALRGKRFVIKHSLIKFGEDYWVMGGLLGKGSSRVKVLPVIYKKNQQGQYTATLTTETEKESVIKIIDAGHENTPWEHVKKNRRSTS